VVRLGFDFEDVPFKIQPERGVGDGQLADLLALRLGSLTLELGPGYVDGTAEEESEFAQT
jgi:hypothetical protein